MDSRVNRRTFLKGSAAAGAAFYVGGCGTSSSVSGTVRLAGGTFGFPSPFAYIGGPGYVQMNLIYDTLVWKDDTGQLLPWLARGVSRSRDGLTYTFQLRNGVKWQDGRPLTAEDVAFTYEYFAKQSLGPLLIAQAFNVRGARATGPLTVEVRLEIPAVTFLGSVAGAVPIIPKHIWQSITDAPAAQDLAVLVGSGPYRLKSYSAGEGSYLYLANDTYFLGKPVVSRVELVPVDDELVALEAGTTDVGETPPEGVSPDALATFRANPNFGIVQQTGSFMFPLIWNLGKGGALADVRFRRACALAIDRGALVSRLVGTNGVPGNPGFLPPGHPYHVDVEQYSYNPAAANRLLDSAGYHRASPGATRHAPGGGPVSFQVLTGNSPVPPVLDLLIPALRNVGVDVSTRAVDLPTLFSLAQQGADELALTLYPGPQGASPNSDPDTLRAYYSSRIKGRLEGAQGYVNPEFDRLADAQLVTADVAKRKQMIARMQHIIASDVPALPLYYSTLFTVFRKSAFDQWYYTPGGLGSGLPSAINKQALITGTKTGMTIRRR
ncbi:MAG TPA: ABC transporter substrate-binding protein [Solirubrobacteraceae bacterium]|nr:ABC transporter substrate-binding protein [Solirubrobacteraceae bacterium]